jgi:endogenous inhibitor of DNA gyrase (YacG/DUF329 family)
MGLPAHRPQSAPFFLSHPTDRPTKVRLIPPNRDGGSQDTLKVTEQNKNLEVRCPKCGRRGNWFVTGYGPFCSERCKLIDMGQWFEEGYRISEPLRPDHFSEFENLPTNTDPDQPA